MQTVHFWCRNTKGCVNNRQDSTNTVFSATREGSRLSAAVFVIDLPDLGGAAKIEALGVPVRTLVSFEGE